MRVFDEDNIMRYHFIGFSDYDYDATPKVVLDFLKNRLKELKDQGTSDLSEFIDSYVTGLGAYFATLAALVKRADTDVEYFKFFSVLGPNTNLYPLLIALGQRGWLDQPIDPVNKVTLLRLLALVDIRVYKIRGTEPKADISRFTFEVYHDKIPFAQCVQWLKDYLDRWMGDSLLKANLSGNVYDNFRAMLPFTLLEQNEALDVPFALATLKTIVLGKSTSLTVEHILAQHPTFSAKAYGFADEEEFAFYQHHLGNLSIIEKSLNSAANSKSPTEKVPYYDVSLFRACKAVGTTIEINRKFHKDDIDVRTAKLLEFYLDQYCLK